MATKLDLAEQWLRAFMKQHRSAPSKQIRQAASEAGISAGNLHLARQRIAEIEIVTGGYPRTSRWLYKSDEAIPTPEKKPAEEQLAEQQSRQVPLNLNMRQFADHARALIAASHRQPRHTATDRWPLP
jgi:hypothetical protein